MNIIYLGAEVPSNRLLLSSAGATSMGVSYWRLVKRGLPKTKKYMIENYFDEETFVLLHPGIPRNMKIGRTELEEFAADYEEFVVDNIDRINRFTEINHPDVSPDFVRAQRETVWAEMPPAKFLPVWNELSGKHGLAELTAKYLDVGVSGEAIEGVTWLAGQAQSYIRKEGTRFHALGCARPDNLRQVPVSTASTQSWLSPMIRGETIVWDGGKLVRYPKDLKDQARPRYKGIYEKAGLDFDKILADDNQEVCKLAVWSFDQLEKRLTTMINDPAGRDYYEDDSDMLGHPADADSVEVTRFPSDMLPPKSGKIVPRNPEEMGNLPVFGFESKQVVEDDGTIRDVPIIQSQQVSLRVCDTCFVASNCPAFKPSSVCAFKLPIEVKTKDQLKSLINSMIEMQGQRVAFMRFSEEMSGGYADPNLSQELDRLFKLIKTTKELDDSREFIRMTVERQGTSGVLSQIFGEKAKNLNELPNGGLTEDQTTQIIKGSIED
jgi:hypothetical protein